MNTSHSHKRIRIAAFELGNAVFLLVTHRIQACGSCRGRALPGRVPRIPSYMSQLAGEHGERPYIERFTKGWRPNTLPNTLMVRKNVRQNVRQPVQLTTWEGV